MSTLDKNRIGEVIDSIIDEHWDKLSDWEQSFMTSIKDQWEERDF